MAEIGPVLREARIRARIDISEVEEETKIRAKYLRAIENEEWDLLPGQIYVRSFLKSYGDYLGLDSRLLVEEFKRRYERPAELEFAHPPPPRQRRERGERGGGGGRRAARGDGQRGKGGRGGAQGPAPVRPGLPPERRFVFGPKSALAVAIVAICIALYLIGIHSSKKTSAITPQGSGQSDARGAHRKHHHGKAARHRAKANVNSTAKGATQATLTLVPTGSVWLCVEGPGDKVLVPGQTYSRGEVVPRAVAKTLFVALGNSNVAATVNGKSYPVAASASAIAFKVTPSGVRRLSHGPTCGT